MNTTGVYGDAESIPNRERFSEKAVSDQPSAFSQQETIQNQTVRYRGSAATALDWPIGLSRNGHHRSPQLSLTSIQETREYNAKAPRRKDAKWDVVSRFRVCFAARCRCVEFLSDSVGAVVKRPLGPAQRRSTNGSAQGFLHAFSLSIVIATTGLAKK